MQVTDDNDAGAGGVVDAELVGGDERPGEEAAQGLFLGVAVQRRELRGELVGRHFQGGKICDLLFFLFESSSFSLLADKQSCE